MQKTIYSWLILLISLSLSAQLPTTNIVVLDMSINGADEVMLSDPTFATSFNKSGYNNQPFFVSDDELLITSNYDALGLTDVYKLKLGSQKLSRITATEESEYSPVKYKKDKYSVVRQELDDSQPVPQTLWSYPTDQKSFGERLLDRYDNIGYYEWLPNDQIALFLVGDPHKLILVDLASNRETFVSYNVGRALKYDGKGGLYYVQKLGSSWTIRKQDLEDDISKYIVNTLKESEDFEVLPNGALISAQGSKLYSYHPNTGRQWVEIMDLAPYGIDKITRIAAHDKKLAIVISE